MNFNFALYLQLAEELVNIKDNPNLLEAYLRSSVSRSYYSVYLLSRDFYENKYGRIKRKDKQGSHKSLYLAYLNSTNKIDNQIGNNLRRLWNRRIEADYQPEANIDLSTAKICILWAKQTLQQLKGWGAL